MRGPYDTPDDRVSPEPRCAGDVLWAGRKRTVHYQPFTLRQVLLRYSP